MRTAGIVVDFDVQVWLEPYPRIGYERLTAVSGLGRINGKDLLVTLDADPESGDIWARYYNGKKGVNPSAPFNASRLLVTQAAARVPGTTEATREVQKAAGHVGRRARGDLRP